MQPTSRAEADRLLGIAEKLLEEKDLNAARDFALLAQETDPLLNGSDQIMAIADVLIAADKRINDNHHHWYAILQIDIHLTDDADLIEQQYRRLSLLLDPGNCNFPLAESAFKLVGDAWSVLSDPSRKTAYDEELFQFLKVDVDTEKNQRLKEDQIHREKMPVRRNSGDEGTAEVPSSENVWTPCPYCYNLYEYPRVYEGCCLRCANCERAFQVVAIPPEFMPPTVPGKEAYYCSQPYFPIRFTFSKLETSKTTASSDPMPQVISSPSTAPLAEPGDVHVDGTTMEKIASATAVTTVSSKRGRAKKVLS